MGIEAVEAIQHMSEKHMADMGMGSEQQLNIPEMMGELNTLNDGELINKAVTKIMEVKDLNKDGKLSQKELGFSDRVFRGIDTNQDGYVQDGEIRKKAVEIKAMVKTMADVVGMMDGLPSMGEMKKFF